MSYEREEPPDDGSTPTGVAPEEAPHKLDWRYDGQTRPQDIGHVAPEGQFWSFENGMWTLKAMPASTTTTPPPTTTNTGGPTTYGGPTTLSNQLQPFNWNWPEFSPPRFEFSFPEFVPKEFTAPTMEQAEKEPGYAFARDQGIGAMENSAAARGALRSGGTLKDFITFGNKFGEQNYSRVFDRSKDMHNINEGQRFNAHNANFGNAWTSQSGMFDRNYRGAYDAHKFRWDASNTEFQGALSQWLAKLNAITELSKPPA